MKKILLGVASLGLASLALAGEIDPAADPKEGTTVFTNDQKGAIRIEGRLVKAQEPPKTKYVVFAKKGPTGVREDILTLADFALTVDEEKAGFASDADNPMVQVRRVVDGQVMPLLENEKMEFSIHNRTIQEQDGGVVAEKGSVKYDPYQLMGKAQINAIIEVLNEKHVFEHEGLGYRLNEAGVLVYRDERSADEQEYHDAKCMEFINAGNGEIVIHNGTAQTARVPMDNKLKVEVAETVVETVGSLDGSSEIVVFIK